MERNLATTDRELARYPRQRAMEQVTEREPAVVLARAETQREPAVAETQREPAVALARLAT
jgi:hypothetical protein